jgi:hypothetical protein|uniref:hypothetical protein n=1 Tax=[Lactobacillus] rogosae TaxID=706562 RepID=UPI00402AD234
MSKLDEVLDALMAAKYDVIDKNASEKDRNELIIALREKKKAEIVQEIKLEYEQEIVEKATSEIQKRTNKEKVDQLKSLMWNGFFVAFLVGLAINQITELLVTIKQVVPINTNISTLIFSIILLGIVAFMYFYQFIKEAIATLNMLRKGEQKSEE